MKFVKLLQFGLRKGAAEKQSHQSKPKRQCSNKPARVRLGMPAKRLPTLSDLNRKARRKRERLEKHEAQLQEQLQQEEAAKLQADARLRQQQQQSDMFLRHMNSRLRFNNEILEEKKAEVKELTLAAQAGVVTALVLAHIAAQL